MLYFAYGSNLSTARLRLRTPSARPVSRALLRGHRLRWHKVSVDGSGKADAWRTDDGSDIVCGVVFRIEPAELGRLDAAESAGVGYERSSVDVLLPDGASRTAWTYHALLVRPGLLPYAWYHRYVVSGAREHGLPVAYVESLSATASIPDPDPARAAANRLHSV